MAGGRIDIEVDIDAGSVPGKLEKGLAPATGVAAKWAKRTGLAVAAGVGLAVGKTVADGFRSAISAENTEASLKGLYGSAEDAADMMRRIGVVSKSSPIDTSTYEDAATSLAYLGVKGQDAQDIMRNVGLAITAAGGSSEQMDRATLALTNMVNEGRVTRETLNQLSGAGVPVFTALADSIGVSTEELSKLIHDGKIELPQVLSVLQNGTGELFQQMIDGGKAAEKTFGNSFKAAKNAVTDAVGNAMIPALNSLTPVIQSIGAEAPAVIATVGTTLEDLGVKASAAFARFRESDLAHDAVQRLGGVVSSLADTARDVGPAVASIVRSLAEAAAATGVSTWQVFIALLETGAQILDVTLVPALKTLASLMESNQTLVKGLAIAFLAFRTVPGLFSRITRAVAPARTALQGFGGQMRLQQALAAGTGQSIGRVSAAMATVETRLPAVGRMTAAYRGAADGAARFGRSAGVAAAGVSALSSAGAGIRRGFTAVTGALGGPVGIGLIAVAGAAMSVASTTATLKNASDAYEKSARNVAEAQHAVAEAFIESNGAMDDAVKSTLAQRLSAELDGLKSQASQTVSLMDGVGAQIKDKLSFWTPFTRNTDNQEQLNEIKDRASAAKQAKDAFDSLNMSSEQMQDALYGSDAAFNDMYASLAKYGEGAGTAAGIAQKLRNEFIKQREVAKQLGPGAHEIAEGFKVLGDEAATADEKASALKATLAALAGEAPSLFEAESKVAQVHEDVAQAAERAIDASKGFGDELVDQSGRLKGTTENGQAYGDAILKARDSLADFVAAGGNLDEKLPALMDDFYTWGAQLGLTREQVDAVTASMGLVPDTLRIAAEVIGGGGVQAELANIATRLAALKPGEPKIIRVESLTDAAKTAIEGVGATVRRLPNGLVEVRADTPEAEAKLRTLIRVISLIPPGKTIDTSAPGAQGVIDAFEVLGIKVHQDNEKRIVVTDTSKAVMDALDALNVKTTTLEDGTVVITDNVEDVKRDINTLNGIHTTSTHTVSITEQLLNPVSNGTWSNLPMADGGVLPDQATIAPGRGRGLIQWAEGETGGEAFIPLAESKRGRSTAILADVADRFGYGLEKYAAGGMRGAVERTVAFLRGESGKPYQYAGMGNPSWDCSSYSSAGYASLKGLDPYQRWYTTESDFYALGFRRGLDPSGRGMDIGVYNGGGGMYSHMSSALQGVPFESGGNGVIYGPGATPPSDGQFPNKYHLPEGAFVPPPSPDDAAATTSTSAAPSTGEPKTPAPPAPELAGRLSDEQIEAQSLELAVAEARRRRDEAYADAASTPEDLLRADLALQRALNALEASKKADDASSKGAEAPSLGGRKAASVPELFGNAASAAVSGQMSSLLKELGVPNGGSGGLVGALISNADALDEASRKIAPAFSQQEIAKQGPVTPGSPGWIEELMKTIDLPMVLRDSGGPLPHGVAALNLSGDTEWVQTADQKRDQDAELAALRAGSGVSSRELGEMVRSLRELVENPPSQTTVNAPGGDADAIVRRIEHGQHMAMLSRPGGRIL
ncbi:tape measure protein [Tomitella gaofuii]|uniref:tape measure protein n=1 Tax=Tomitella gaofuii TaxID=2760083 RepID=UPI0015F8D0B7|nr:tape measure protein [Tomitella gaofuii]